MSKWTIHFLNARERLSDLPDLFQEEIFTTKDLLGRTAPELTLDIVIRASDFTMPPSLVVAGSALGPGRIELTVDLNQSISKPDLKGQLQRTLIHEYHHAMRWEGPGYGRTLGETLTSEGLAQRFVHEIVTCQPEPWEVAVPVEELPTLALQASPLYDSADFSHSAWFFGRSDLPVWAGYTLGRAMIDIFLEGAPDETALSLINKPASIFRDTLSGIANNG